MINFIIVKATRISYRNAGYLIENSVQELRVIVEVWKIPEPENANYPDSLKVSILAFLESNPDDLVLVDCHPPKGPHFHMDGKEVAFAWSSFEDAEKLFWDLVEGKFGKIKK